MSMSSNCIQKVITFFKCYSKPSQLSFHNTTTVHCKFETLQLGQFVFLTKNRKSINAT